MYDLHSQPPAAAAVVALVRKKGRSSREWENDKPTLLHLSTLLFIQNYLLILFKQS
jgi:hypothetical protein